VKMKMILSLTAELKRRFEERALEILSKGAVGFGEFAVEHFFV